MFLVNSGGLFESEMALSTQKSVCYASIRGNSDDAVHESVGCFLNWNVSQAH